MSSSLSFHCDDILLQNFRFMRLCLSSMARLFEWPRNSYSQRCAPLEISPLEFSTSLLFSTAIAYDDWGETDSPQTFPIHFIFSHITAFLSVSPREEFPRSNLVSLTRAHNHFLQFGWFCCSHFKRLAWKITEN